MEKVAKRRDKLVNFLNNIELILSKDVLLLKNLTLLVVVAKITMVISSGVTRN